MPNTKLDININWYPGHMTKSRRELEKKLPLIDMVIEVLDARAPLATQNRDFDSLFKNKKRMYILNKADMADDAVTKEWLAHFKAEGVFAVSFSAVSGNTGSLLKSIKDCAADIYEKYEKKGMKKTVRAIVCGIPNVGKSAILNRLAGAKKLKVGNMPGVTRGLAWVKLGDYLELMDSPGMLPPKIANAHDGAIIASIGSIRRDILDEDTLCLYLIEMLGELCPDKLMERYKLTETGDTPLKTLESICIKRGFFVGGREPDYDRGIQTVLEEFKNGKIGKISLQRPLI